MGVVQRDSDDDIDEFLRSLPPAPESWVSRAEELPLLEEAAQVLHDRHDGSVVDEAALKSALLQVGLDPDERRAHALARLRELREG
jgi:hypothetical protein